MQDRRKRQNAKRRHTCVMSEGLKRHSCCFLPCLRPDLQRKSRLVSSRCITSVALRGVCTGSTRPATSVGSISIWSIRGISLASLESWNVDRQIDVKTFNLVPREKTWIRPLRSRQGLKRQRDIDSSTFRSRSMFRGTNGLEAYDSPRRCLPLYIHTVGKLLITCNKAAGIYIRTGLDQVWNSDT